MTQESSAECSGARSFTEERGGGCESRWGTGRCRFPPLMTESFGAIAMTLLKETQCNTL